MKTKVLFFVVFFLMGFSALFSQTISESDVPQDVFISFKYKYPDATISSWESVAGNFLAHFKLSDQEGKAEFTANGKWIASRFVIAEKELPSPIVTYFRDNYRNKDYQLTLSELVKDGNGETYYYLQTKKSGLNQRKPVELFFDLNGGFLRKIEPEESGATTDNSQTVVAPQDTSTASGDFTKKELPTPVTNYIRANFADYTVKETQFLNDPAMGEVYYILLKEQGFKEQVELYFDIYGTLVKKVDSREVRANQAKKDVTPEVKAVVNQPTPEEVKKKTEGDPIADTKVPALAKTHFAGKNKKATDVSWYLVEKDYVARYMLAGKKSQARYSAEGAWKETRMEYDPETLSAVMLGFLKDNFRKYKTVKAEFVQQAPKSKFYEVHIVEKNNKETNPPVTKIFFDGNGKYTSIERPDVADDPDALKQQEEEEKAFLDQVDASNQTIEKGTGVNDVVNPKELPTEIIQYIKTKFPEHKIKESRYLFDDDLNNHIYYVTVKIEGDKYEIELFFDLAGKFLKKIDPTEKKYNEENSSNNNEVVVEDAMTSGAENVDPKELPSTIKNYLKQNYPDSKIDQSLYTTNEEFGNVYFLVLKKSGTKTVDQLWFDLNGKLVKSEQSN
jgi:hypothetical protein